MSDHRHVGLVTLLTVLVAPAVAAPVSVEFPSGRTNFFGGRAAALPVAIRGGDAVEGRLVWMLAAKGRTLASGAVGVRHAAAADTAANLAIDIPAVKDGVVFDAELTVALADAADEQLATRSLAVRIFAADPFVDRRRWLESRKFVLVDPSGRTERVLAAAGVPFELASAEADLRPLASGLVVVGEGTSWIDHPALTRRLMDAATRGARVLCLAPLDGMLPLPDAPADDDPDVVTSLTLRTAAGVGEFDDRLDARGWGVEGEAVASRLAVVPKAGGVGVRAGTDPRGWAWLEAVYAAREPARTPGKLIVCGFGIVAHWDETPAARYLFAALLECLTAGMIDEQTERPTVAPPEKKE